MMQSAKEYTKKARNTLAEHYLDIACEKLPVINQAISKYGDSSLSTYLQELVPKNKPAYQPMNDLFEVIQQYAGSLLGNSVAKRLVQDIAEFSVVLTANHHGVDYFSQSVQGSLIFALRTLKGIHSATTIPIFSCGNIPINNLTYPKGLLLYNVNPAELESMPAKVPIFTRRFKTQSISVVPAFDQTMIINAKARFDNMLHDRQISPTLASPVHEIFQEDYCAPSVLEMPTYSHQSTVLNNRIWKRLFTGVTPVPDMVYIELEKITGCLLKYDLSNPKSLAWNVMFDKVLRSRILTELDGVNVCWNRKLLKKRLHFSTSDELLRKACGTVFFWGIDSRMRRVPLHIETDAPNNEVLRGVDSWRNQWELPYNTESIVNALHEGRLLPSVFTCFLTLSFARGLICVGAFFQGEYLPTMQQGVVKALQKTAGYQDVAHLVAQVPVDYYIPGMLTAMTRAGKECLVPAGPAEIIAGGGITNDDIEQMLLLTVREAHIGALFETIPDLVPVTLRPSDWKKQLASDCFRLLDGKIVIK
ncbi:MAG: hypothetical protein GY749_01875 [Desulfobacteraceae bacterium]|nr:hypothetical protein [Desulfobacteraceae bacterium]